MQANTRWKAPAEIYTTHSFAPFWNRIPKTQENYECLGPQVLLVLTVLSFRFSRTVLQGRKRQHPFHGQASPVGVWSFLSLSSTRKKKEKTRKTMGRKEPGPYNPGKNGQEKLISSRSSLLSTTFAREYRWSTETIQWYLFFWFLDTRVSCFLISEDAKHLDNVPRCCFKLHGFVLV